MAEKISIITLLDLEKLDIKNTSNTIKLEKDDNNIITTIKNG